MQIFLQTCMGVPAIFLQHANFPADMHGSPGGHAQPRHAQMCGVRVQAWPDTCKDFPAAWNLCHEFAWSHVARKFSRSIRSGWGVARIFLLNEICARISLQGSGCQVPSPARARISLQGSGCRVPSVWASFGCLQVSSFACASLSKFRLLASLKLWVAKIRRVVSAS